ncbi:hypothetical protein, partial [Micromonospora tarensis]
MHTWHVWRPLLNHYLRTLTFRATTTELDVATASAGASHRTRVTATATVGAVSTSTSAPAGTVDFYAGDQRIGSARVHHGVARLTTTVHGELTAPVSPATRATSSSTNPRARGGRPVAPGCGP